jgi:hypothetical protein
MTMMTLLRLKVVVFCLVVDFSLLFTSRNQVISPLQTAVETEYSLALNYSSHRQDNTTFGHISDTFSIMLGFSWADKAIDATMMHSLRVSQSLSLVLCQSHHTNPP